MISLKRIPLEENAAQKQLSLKNEKWSLESINNLTFV